jgi:tetratricopeptide (TPR) repeat protein
MSKTTYGDIITNMRRMMKDYISMGLYTNALFYADKIFYLKSDQTQLTEPLLDLAQCYYYNKEYSRCVNIIQKYNMINSNIKFTILLGQALLACEDYESVISYLDKSETEISQDNILESVKYLIIGKAYELQENKPAALRSYIRALELDPGNIEAFEILTNHNLLTSEQKKTIIKDLKYDIHNTWLHDYYVSRWDDNIYITNSSNFGEGGESGNVLETLLENNDQDMTKMQAEKYFINRDYSNAYNMLKKYILIIIELMMMIFSKLISFLCIVYASLN